ncbi:MAG: DNA topoisomerase, partial [Caldilineaceae bacterium]
MTKLVIVESPTKAKTIRGYLPAGYVVEASMGHVRDLPSSAAEIPATVKGAAWARLGVNVEKDFEPLYVVPADKKKTVTRLKQLLADADELILATDEDREGESIGWHLHEVLKPRVPVRRMVFHEITRDAIQEALGELRTIDQDLVRAQETRRILDRLVGYTVSPLLWKKIAPRLSAGRVQSVAVRLLVMRERERRAFRAGSYWDLTAMLSKRPDTPRHRFEALLVSVGDKRVASGRDFDENTGALAAGKQELLLLDQKQAAALADRIRGGKWVVTNLESREATRS